MVCGSLEDMTGFYKLATAFCPDVPSGSESRGRKLHGIRQEPESPNELGLTLCGRLCNEPVLVPTDLVSTKSVCRVCLRSPGFLSDVRMRLGC